MRRLIVLRHAKSDWSTDEADHDRPLAKRGRRQAPEAGRWLAAHAGRIDLVVVSTAARTRQTWALAAAELDHAPEVRLDEDVYAAWGRELEAVVRALPDAVRTVVLVGHNPAVEDLVSALSGVEVAMPTSALAVLEWSGAWADPWRDPAPERPVVRLVAQGRPPA